MSSCLNKRSKLKKNFFIVICFNLTSFPIYENTKSVYHLLKKQLQSSVYIDPAHDNFSFYYKTHFLGSTKKSCPHFLEKSKFSIRVKFLFKMVNFLYHYNIPFSEISVTLPFTSGLFEGKVGFLLL